MALKKPIALAESSVVWRCPYCGQVGCDYTKVQECCSPESIRLSLKKAKGTDARLYHVLIERLETVTNDEKDKKQDNMSHLPPAIRGCVRYGIPVSISAEGYEVHDFYKSGTVLLVPTTETAESFTAHARYGETDYIETFEDLVELFKRYSDSDENEPSRGWAKAIADIGYRI